MKISEYKKLTEPSEHIIQSQIIQHLRFHNIFCFAVPNGIFFNSNSKRSGYAYANKLKAEGFLVGCSDIVILLKKRAIFVECKRNSGKQSDMQKDFEKKVKSLGFEYYIWRDVSDAEKFVEELEK